MTAISTDKRKLSLVRKQRPVEHDIQTAIAALDDKKAQDITVISLKGKSAMADALVIATGTSDRHVTTLVDNVRQALERDGTTVLSVEGTDTGHWVLLDAGSMIVHVFQPEARQMYRLERLWSPTFWDEDDTALDTKAEKGIV